MQTISPRKMTYMLVGAFSLGMAGLAVAAPPAHHGGMDRLQAVDTNGDGVVSKEEFVAKRSEKFGDADVDGSAGLSLEEFTVMHEKREAERRARRVQHRFERLDANDDGIVDEAELAAKADKMFGRLDANDDGALSGDELKRGRHWARHHGGRMGHGWRHGPGHGDTPEAASE